MHIHVLGPVSVATDGKLHGIQANKVRAMLATLALDAGRAVAHGDLADELWAGQPLGNTRNALQAHATRLRKVLDGHRLDAHRPCRRGGTVLRAVRGGYLLDVPPGSVDGDRFLDLATRGAAALPVAPERAIELLQAALELWRGPALLDAGDGLRCRGAAALFDERRLTVREDLIRARLAVGDAARAVAELRRLVAQHPLRERFCELLMLGLYRTGRQAEALELFHVTRRRLDEELGVRPGIVLQRRHTEILSQDPALSLSTATAAT
ncbi:AfsR/SARP family transcriptional regulator [Streptomyces flavofungini]|uniref:AfsR/SARP family transcriptional regulator n=1 Tax=Streptomyces flavofungini TaxID=68200 RepID=UPI0025B21D79|nr:AfsR/SARP family transcriptional regulator [Streptomyces flavofungini]WJV44995.1 AfsR/SARP family transcriptional regulator [Streptomyces flavofungini]